MKYISVVIMLACLALAAGAVPLTATWIDGDVYLRDGSEWVSIYEGDDIDSASIIRVGPGSLAEFTSGARRIALSSEGTFNLDTLLSSSDAQAHKRSTVVAKLSRVVDTRVPRSTVVAGVRGSFEGAPETTQWALDDDSPEALAEEAWEYIDKGEYIEAAVMFGQAAMDSLGDKQDEYYYTQAWCYAAADDPLSALMVLRPMNPSDYYAVPRAILLARLSLDTGAPKEAAAALEAIAGIQSINNEDAALIQELQEEIAAAL